MFPELKCELDLNNICYIIYIYIMIIYVCVCNC